MQKSLHQEQSLKVGHKTYWYYPLKAVEEAGFGNPDRLPFTLKILLENLLRHYDDHKVTQGDIKALVDWLKTKKSTHEIAFHPVRVLMQDFTGVPAIVDLAAMRDAIIALGNNPEVINPLTPVDLIIDHSVIVDYFGTSKAFEENVHKEFARNFERYAFLRWGQKAFKHFRVVPPGTGICHQVNLEHLGKTVWSHEEKNKHFAYPDTLVGMDSHTTMINSLAVLGWGVGGIEAEAVMLGQPLSMIIPEVIGFKLTGELAEGTTATDLVLTITQILRSKNVVGKFVEFCGPGLDHLSIPDRATIANMSPEYGATCGFFPIDQATLDYLKFTGRDGDTLALVESYAKAQGLWRGASTADPIFTELLTLDISTVKPCLAGPRRPQDKVNLDVAKQTFIDQLPSFKGDLERKVPVAETDFDLQDGHIVIAAITSCTNTSNPSVMIAAGLVAKKAIEKGLKVKPWVKTSLAPGSRVVTEYFDASNLQTYLDQLGFELVGYGCTTCIGNSGPLPQPIADTLDQNDMVVCSVLSGNRNFEGRIHPQVKANFLASPPLVVAYALAGSIRVDITKEPIGTDKKGEPVYLKDIWPSNKEVQDVIARSITPEMFRKRYADVFHGDKEWRDISVTESETYDWSDKSTYVKNPPYFTHFSKKPQPVHDIKKARILAIFGDSITTDHISPAGSIKKDSPAGRYLIEHGVQPIDFNSYGSRRGNHEVMMRGTFANIRIHNEMVPGVEGGMTRYIPDNEIMPIYDAAMKYKKTKTPLVIFAGKEYGTGSSRDWAAKGTKLLGIRAVIAESFERIHRSNLIGMGVIPLQFANGITRHDLNLKGNEIIDIVGLTNGQLHPRSTATCTIHYANGSSEQISLLSRIDTEDEVEYFQNDGILSFVLRQLAEKKTSTRQPADVV